MSSILNAPKIPFKKPNTIPSKFVLNCSNALTVKKELDLLLDIEEINHLHIQQETQMSR